MSEPPWHFVSPSGVLHVVRSDEMLRQLGNSEGLKYEKLALHLGLKQTATPPKHIKGWRELSRTQWLWHGELCVCVVDKDASYFIAHINSDSRHPMYGAFVQEDAPRLAHLLNSGWIWSNNTKVDYNHA